jgi:hypothetical protein
MDRHGDIDTKFQAQQCTPAKDRLAVKIYTERRPVMKLMTNSTRKTTKRIFAMVAATPAIPKKPKAPANMAMIRKISEFCSIYILLAFLWQV